MKVARLRNHTYQGNPGTILASRKFRDGKEAQIVELESYCDLTVTFVKDFSSMPPTVSKYG